MSSKVQISKRLVLINSASSVLAHFINISVVVWLNQYLIRRIGPEEYSLYPVLVGVMMFVPMLTMFLTSGLARYTTEAYAHGDDDKITQIASTLSLPLIAAGIIILAGGLLLAWYVNHALSIPPERLWDARIMLALLMFSAAIRLPLAPFSVGLYVRQKFILQNLLTLGEELLRVTLLFILLFGISTRVLWVVLATVSANIVWIVVRLVISIRLVPALRFRPSKINWRIARRVIGFGTWSLLDNIGGMIGRTLDPILLNRLATAMDVTCYHLGVLPLRYVYRATWLATSPLEPQLTAMYATGSHGRLKRAYLRGCRYGLWTVMFVTLPAIVYRNELITLYVGEQYLDAATIMALMLAVGSFTYTNWFMPKLAHATAQMRPLALRTIFALTIRVALSIYLVGWWKMGGIGMAWATVIVGFPSGVFLSIPLGWKLAGVTPGEWFKESALRGIIPGLVALPVWIGLSMLAPPWSWASLAAYTSAGCVLYMVVMVFCLDNYDRLQVRKLISRFMMARVRA